MTTVDDRGRLASRSPIGVLNWGPDERFAVSLRHDVVVVTTLAGGCQLVSRQGYLRLPNSVRHTLQLSPGDRLLLAMHSATGSLIAFPPSTLDAMARFYFASLDQEVAQ